MSVLETKDRNIETQYDQTSRTKYFLLNPVKLEEYSDLFLFILNEMTNRPNKD